MVKVLFRHSRQKSLNRLSNFTSLFFFAFSFQLPHFNPSYSGLWTPFKSWLLWIITLKLLTYFFPSTLAFIALASSSRIPQLCQHSVFMAAYSLNIIVVEPHALLIIFFLLRSKKKRFHYYLYYYYAVKITTAVSTISQIIIINFPNRFGSFSQRNQMDEFEFS